MMKTEYLAYHNNKACDMVKEMLDQCRAVMKELGLRTLRIEDDPCVVIYDYDRINYIGLSEHVVQAIYIDDEDDMVLKMQPYSPGVKFTNDEATGPDCPELDFEKDETIIWVDSEDVMYLSLLELDDHISAAFNSYIRENRPFVEKDYFCSNVGDYRDSMELDSCQEIAAIEGYIGKYTVEANVIVSGSVRVIFRDQVYRAASKMPKELLQCYHDLRDPAEVASSDGGEYETPYFCDDNNWLEETIIIRDAAGNVAVDYDCVIDFPEDNTPEGWRKMLIEDIRDVMNDNEL